MEDKGLSEVLSLCQGAWATKLISVALELELFTRVSKGADTVDKISEESGIDVRMLHMIIHACRSLGLLTGSSGTIRNSSTAKRFLVKGGREYVGNFASLIGEDYYEVWRGLKNVVLTGNPVRDDRVVKLSDPRYAEAYIKSMHDISTGAAERLASTLSMPGRKNLLEVNGGLGTYSLAFTRKNSDLKAVIFDSPFSCDLAGRGMKPGRVTTKGGDIEKGAVPSGHDIIMLTHVFQSMAPQKCEGLLKRVYDALPAGGMVIVNEFLLEEGNAFSSLMALNAFMLSNGGTLYTPKEMSEWLSNVGFKSIRNIRTSPVIISLYATK